MLKEKLNYFTKAEKLLWLISACLIIISFVCFDRENYFNLISSLIGITSLIFAAKGNFIGSVLMIIFSIFYGYISYTFSYYGEMVTYLGMTLPMSVFTLVSWLKNPYNGKKTEVAVNKISKKEIVFLAFLSTAVTVLFFFILRFFNTANLIPSTLSVTTSFTAVYLTARRSPYFAIAYAANDIILIVLWTLASLKDISYISVVVCFAVFLANDLYGFINWQRMKKRQNIY